MYPYKLLTSGSGPYRSITTVFGALPRTVLNKLLTVMEIHRQRRALESLDDRLLKDIGVTRCDIDREVSRPLWR